MTTKLPILEDIRCDNIEATAATQVRVRLDRAVIDQYTEDLKNGADMPPIVVFREPNSERNILADGFHRLYAAVNAEWPEIGAEVHEGGMLDALQYALGANSEHGLRRTNADKRHAVEMALKDPELSKLKAQEIADICRVSKRTVERAVNEQLSDGGDKNDSQNATKSQNEPKEPDAGDFRDTGKDPSQAEVDLENLREACSTINGMSYSGIGAADKLDLAPDDVGDIELASTWLADVVITMRNRGDGPDEPEPEEHDVP